MMEKIDLVYTGLKGTFDVYKGRNMTTTLRKELSDTIVNLLNENGVTTIRINIRN